MSPRLAGPAYEDSVNVGMTDLVAALRWVHENIANFGGDPDKVMIYGQSGGGGKVTTLMGMPSAQGLFHRASIQSGGGGGRPQAAKQKEFTRQLMKQLGIAPERHCRAAEDGVGDARSRLRMRLQGKMPPRTDARFPGQDLGRRGASGCRLWMARSSTCDRSRTPRPRSRRMCRC